MRKLQSILALTASALYLFPTIAGHSWVEDLTLIAPNGTFTGPHGYSRGFAPRKEGYKDALMKHQLPPERALLPGEATAGILPNDTMCKESQLEPIQSDGFPRLKAPPGAPIALRYLENGHVSFPNTPEGKPHGGGKVYVYGTTQPRRRETFCSIHNVWNKEGTGGDRRGMLLSVHNFDDGRCHQITSGSPISKHRQNQFSYRINGNNAELWCQHDLALPQNAPVGKPYTLYWVWIWDTMPNIDPNVKSGKQETYTTCLDVDIIAPSGDLKVAAKGELPMLKYVQDQDVGSAAIPSQFENLKAPIIPGYSSSNPPALEKPTSTTRAPAPSAFKPKPEPEPEPEPEDDDCDTPSTTVSAPQTPSKTPSNSRPAIIPLFASTSSSATATASISSASPDSASTSNNGGAIRTTFRMTFGSIVRGGSATASSSPTTVPETISTKSPEDAFRIISSANISPSLSSYPLLISGINFGPATAITVAAPFPATYEVVAPSQASPPDSISTSSENDGFVVSPITLGDDGLVVHSTTSTTAPLTPKTTALRSTTTITISSTASATAPPNEKTTTIRVTSTITISSTTTQPPQSTATCPESNPPATILLPSPLPIVKSLAGEFPEDYFFRTESQRSPPPGSWMSPEQNLPYISRDVADLLIATFFSMVHPCHPILDPDEFYTIYENVMATGLDYSLQSAQCLVVFALGVLASQASGAGARSGDWAPGMEYFQPALQILMAESAVSLGSNLLLPQTLIFGGVYFAYMARPLHSWKLIHLASTEVQLLLSRLVVDAIFGITEGSRAKVTSLQE
ncbi:hypothetical protein PAAG_12097 [Paracoccidioides lutzii Pb01]|uniref:DUF7492 domain-containing protein n=1 Tax=Paracoccidioides lutzii (strain ATCC MYA-826 / Pb01) TaxID=502779 RepID=A0A0A2VK32_PARBA|nr:hypothetical protein PAAG_12097 [Paracoccidioides lutzii Pb01]KGQ01239.1 hypothetical protein PAAG_12097 [Paracoccidioides lutzii Pb01]